MMDAYDCFGAGIAKEALLLIGLALGYIVCFFAKQEEKSFKLLGIFIGTLIITLCLSFLLAMAILNLKMNCALDRRASYKSIYMHKFNPNMMQQRMMMPPPVPVPQPPQQQQGQQSEKPNQPYSQRK
ncbi:MAG: hypothetical protein PHN57_03770 [Candidatus Omnitrophica bacterium]|nr:hypothetical protein [Candidatus Omnitrophota bacterium]